MQRVKINGVIYSLGEPLFISKSMEVHGKR